MRTLSGSVGINGQNVAKDVSYVQELLNTFDLKPLAKLKVDGKIGSKTITMIEEFQRIHVRMHKPDGRVDPGGRTLRALRTASQSKPAQPQIETPESRKNTRTARRKLVDPRVKETKLTTQIIDGLIPYFEGENVKIISGFLSDTDLLWKINYHWEYLLNMVDHSLKLPVSDSVKKQLSTIRSQLLAKKPEPAQGYVSSPIGKPVDKSSMEIINLRHTTVTQCKKSFKKIYVGDSLDKLSKKGSKAFALAAAPVAKPSKSKHGTGYALDIQGDANVIKDVCKKTGATLVFDEKSHIHVEFKNGVKH